MLGLGLIQPNLRAVRRPTDLSCQDCCRGMAPSARLAGLMRAAAAPVGITLSLPPAARKVSQLLAPVPAPRPARALAWRENGRHNRSTAQ
jgi:hypothetical protein